MRDSNYKAISNNKAAVTITTSLYDRRALDVTSDKPLVNSLNYLTYLVSSSAKVRETLSIDGGIERLIEILHECHNNNIQDNTNNEKKLLTAWKWTLAFQCLVLAGTRGTEKIRQKVVEAGILPIIATVLDNYLSLNERTFLHANARQLLPQQQQQQSQQLGPPQDANSDLPDRSDPTHIPFTNPFPPQMNSQPRQNIREQFAVFNTQVDTNMMQAAAPQVTMDDTINQTNTTNFSNFNMSDDAYANPIQVATAAIERTSISNNNSSAYFNHVSNLTFDDYENLTIEQLFKLIRIANLGPQYANGDQPPPHYKNNTINNDIRRRYIIVNIINKLKQEKQLEMLDDKFFNDCDYEMDSNLQFLSDMYTKDFENNRITKTSSSVRNFTETGVVIPRDDDIVWSLQLLAYISKYPYLKDVLQNTHLVLDMSIREKHARSNLERQMKLKMKKNLAIKLRSSTNNSPKSLKLSCLTFKPSPSNSPQMVNTDSLILEDETIKLLNDESTGLTENAEIDDEAESVEADDDDDDDDDDDGSDIISNASVNTEELLMDDYAKRTIENSDYLVKLYDSIIDCESIVDDLEREISLFQINERMNKFIELESKKLTNIIISTRKERKELLEKKWDYDNYNNFDIDDNGNTEDQDHSLGEYRRVNLFPMVEKFTFLSGTDMYYWSGIIMRNSCRRNDLRGGVRQCGNLECGRWESYPREFSKCRRCKRTKYCSRDCQMRAWHCHRNWCIPSTSSSTSNTTASNAHGGNTETSTHSAVTTDNDQENQDLL